MLLSNTLFALSTLVLFKSSQAQPQPLQTTSLVWSEEFNYNGPLDSSRWSYDLGNGSWGWGNGEVQDYTQQMDNVRVEGGSLVIDVKRNLQGGNTKFTSSRVKTQGKVEFQYGSVDVRLMLPNLQNGYWPALWMLGSNFNVVGWPRTGEIDIMEAGQADSIASGKVNQVVSSAAHWDANGYASYGEHVDTGSSFVNQWLHFRMDWTPNMISTFVDGQHIWSLDIGACGDDECSEFRQPYFIIANVAVGGRFTGIMQANDVTASPGQMLIDYIRIYSNVEVDATMTAGGILQAPPDDGDSTNPSPTPATAESPPTYANSLPDDTGDNTGDSSYATNYGVIDCGVPTSCTASVLGRAAGDSTCMGHIEYLMKARGRDELYACDTVARKSFPAECGACNPGTGAPPQSYNFDCGDATMCSNAVLNTDAPQPVGHTCGERISHLIEVEGKSEQSACATVAGVEFPNECGKCVHGIVSCGKPAGSSCHSVLDTLAGAHTCRSRISWMVYNQGYTETEACRHVATDSQSASVCSPCLP